MFSLFPEEETPRTGGSRYSGWLTVSELTKGIQNILEGAFTTLRLEGEISNFRPSRAGHIYFTLKDSQAVIQAVLFRGNAASLRFHPRDGMKVRVTGELSVYAPRGNYQIICRTMEQAGQGELLALLEERKQKLAALGLFDQDRKQPIPLFPRRVAVITSPTGAALRDILNVMGRRHRGVHLLVMPATVQGTSAAAEIAAQIRRANTHQLGDVIILARGGGSLEDLLPFSEEAVVRAIAESAIPVISGVGHETDISLADLAADYRAPTPSSAAEMVAQSREILLERVSRDKNRIRQALQGRMERNRLLIDRFSARELRHRLALFMMPHRQHWDESREALAEAMNRYIDKKRHALALTQARIEAQNPLAVLKRGYALVEDENRQRIITSAEEAEPGQKVAIRTWDGRLTATIDKIERNEEKPQ